MTRIHLLFLLPQPLVVGALHAADVETHDIFNRAVSNGL